MDRDEALKLLFEWRENRVRAIPVPPSVGNTSPSKGVVFKRVQILSGGLAIFHNIHRGDGLRKRAAAQRAG